MAASIQNHIQFLRTSGSTAPTSASMLEGELAVNVNASTPKIYLKTKTNVAEFGNNGNSIINGSSITYDGQTLAPATSSITQTMGTLFQYVVDNEETAAAALNDLDGRINTLSGSTIDYVNSAGTATNATMVGGKYIDTITRSEYESAGFTPQNNHVYLIYG